MEKSQGLYERVLERLGKGVSLPAPKAPRSSASGVLWRRADSGIEVYWIQRAAGLRFMGGWHAFPGGGLARTDAAIEVTGEPRGWEEAPADAAIPEAVVGGVEIGPVLAPGILACLARELFEEIGVPLTRSSGGDLSPELAADREALLAGDLDFATLLQRRGLVVDASELVYAGRWLTPPLGPLRFDNRFFLLEWPADREPRPMILGGEADLGEWVRPAEALARWQAGELITAPPILHILRVLEEDGPEAGAQRLRNPQEANLGPYRMVEFKPGVILFPVPTRTLPPSSHTNCFLIGHGEAALIDPGCAEPEEIEALLAAVREADRRLGRRVREIWLTHHHPDHVGGVNRLREALDVPVCAHDLTAERLQTIGIEVDRALRDGDRLSLAGDPPISVQVLHTPGHASGHLCFHLADQSLLLAGDMVAGFGTIVVDPPEGDMDDYLSSLERIAALDPETVFPAHGPVLMPGAPKIRETIRHRLWREERILEAWRAGRTEPRAILEGVYDDVPRPALPLAERQIQAHLDRLRKQGRLVAKPSE